MTDDATAWRAVTEWELYTQHPYQHPFTDLTLNASFAGPSGQTVTIPGFYDGKNTWRVRSLSNLSRRPARTGMGTYGTGCCSATLSSRIDRHPPQLEE